MTTAQEEHYQYQFPPVIRKLFKVLITFTSYLQFSCLLATAFLPALSRAHAASASSPVPALGAAEGFDPREGKGSTAAAQCAQGIAPQSRWQGAGQHRHPSTSAQPPQLSPRSPQGSPCMSGTEPLPSPNRRARCPLCPGAGLRALSLQLPLLSPPRCLCSVSTPCVGHGEASATVLVPCPCTAPGGDAPLWWEAINPPRDFRRGEAAEQNKARSLLPGPFLILASCTSLQLITDKG